MRKLFVLLVVAALAAGGGWYFGQKYGPDGLKQTPLGPLFGGTSGETASATGPPVTRDGETIRIASFNIQVFGTSKAGKPHVMNVVADIVRRFDIVAVQEIRTQDQNLLPEFVKLINAAGRQYDFVIGPRLGRTSSKEQYAFIFDTASVEIDRSELYTVADPFDLLHREPLVGWFRVRGPATNEAFTFSLVNMHTDPDEAKQEVDELAQAFLKIRDDGRNEDDVILLGDLNVDDQHLGRLGKLLGIAWVVTRTPTNTRGTAQYDNILFDTRATSEYAGRGGVFDFVREYKLTVQQALEVSDHMPVWAEFSIYEGGGEGRIARQTTRRR